ncbi:MAG: hypothetical protein JWN51_222 [Phycisphaerales bacterium]|nr:hypothetical protein [Phycisphaerales bacterium]
MNVTGTYPYPQRARCWWGNPIRRIPKRLLVLRNSCLLASAAFAALQAGGSAAWAVPTLTTLATFDNSNGAEPTASLIADASGNLYGTTYSGGANGYGTVFQLEAGTRALTTLTTFDKSNGARPYGGVTFDAAGNLYGTTVGGGIINDGTVFEIAAGTHALSTLVTFNGTNGSAPRAGLITDAAGNLYGTTSNGGGTNGDGTVFQLAAGTHAFSTLATFNYSNGAFPVGSLLADATGNLYGTADSGGSGFGTVFKVAAGTNTLSTLASFDYHHIYTNGAYPQSGLIADAAGNLYGTTEGDGMKSFGTVFEIAAGTHAFSTLATFDGRGASDPIGGLIADAAGNLYGTTYYGGPNGGGMVFEVAAGTNALSTLATFNRANPSAGLIADADGNLYGTTENGGANNAGTVFELTGTGFVTSAPEPAAVSLIGLAGLGLLARRRRTWRT